MREPQATERTQWIWDAYHNIAHLNGGDPKTTDQLFKDMQDYVLLKLASNVPGFRKITGLRGP